jgi:hypothetical protein
MAYRFSGHETFPFRYPWLPKACIGIIKSPAAFDDEDAAMVEFGVGKNMVRAMRFWVEAAGLAVTCDAGLRPTPIGETFFGENGLDRYLEDIQTLWLLHWNISTSVENPLFAWEFLLNRWQEHEIAEGPVLKAFAQESERLAQKKLSPVTLHQHFDVFLHTYLPTRGKKGELADDNLDCPLTELELITVVGERDVGGKHREPVFAFRQEEKPSISPELFTWALLDFWGKRWPGERTLSAQQIAHGVGSPGQIFKLPEQDVMARLSDLATITQGCLSFQDSTALPQVIREHGRDASPMALLKTAFHAKAANV